jgi:hypothetical protein
LPPHPVAASKNVRKSGSLQTNVKKSKTKQNIFTDFFDIPKVESTFY